MKCVAERACQIRMPDNSIRFFERGRVWEFDECPTHFRALEGPDAKVNFETAKREELLAAEYDVQELRDYIKARFNVSAGNRGKEKSVELLLDLRYREVDLGKTSPIV